MKITGISIEEHRRYVPVKGWDNVVKALTVFSSGFIRGSRATRNVTVDQIGKDNGPDGGMAVGLFLLAEVTVGKPDNFLQEMLIRAMRGLQTRDSWSESFDYDAMGTPFFKTSVEIKILDRTNEIFGIGLYAAYIGDEPEKALADYLGVPRALLYRSIDINVRPASEDHFEFDFTPIVKKLRKVLTFATPSYCLRRLDGKTVADAMMSVSDAYAQGCPVFVLHDDGQLKVIVTPHSVQERFVWNKGSSTDTWSISGSVLTGRLQRDYSKNDPNAKANPVIRIMVSCSQVSHAVWQVDQQNKVVGLANRIASALR